MRVRVRLDTIQDITKFCDVASRIDEEVTLQDEEGHCVSARSLLGAIYSMEWNSVYCCCEKDIASKIWPWTVLHD